MLESCEIETFEMPKDTVSAAETIHKASTIARDKKRPVAVLVRRNVLDVVKEATLPQSVK